MKNVDFRGLEPNQEMYIAKIVHFRDNDFERKLKKVYLKDFAIVLAGKTLDQTIADVPTCTKEDIDRIHNTIGRIDWKTTNITWDTFINDIKEKGLFVGRSEESEFAVSQDKEVAEMAAEKERLRVDNIMYSNEFEK